MLIFLFGYTEFVFSQGIFSPEVGVISGPVQFRTDYGERGSKENNFGNTGFGIGLISYLNIIYKKKYQYWHRSRFVRDHLKLRSEICWNKTDLEHIGTWVDPRRKGEDADKLRAHKGQSQNFDIGLQLEYSFVSAKKFEFFSPRWLPYIGMGVHYTFFTAEVSTYYNNPNPNLIGNVLEPSNFYSSWEPGSIKPSAGYTPSIISSVGIRYKCNRTSDLIMEFKSQYYFSDWVDGLNHQLPSNKYNDFLLWLNFGYILYLD